MKRVFLCILIAAMLSATNVFADSDWQNKYQWAVEAVNYCTANGIMQGDEYGDLMLGRKMTRAQMAKMIVTTFDLPKKEQGSFSDVLANSWEYPYVNSIADYIITDGSYYDPNGFAKREDFIVTIMKVMGGEQGDESVLMEFADVAKVSPQCKGLVATAVQEGIITGSQGNLKPRTSITRAEACVILYRAVNKSLSNEQVGKNEETGYNENSFDTTIIGKAKITVEQAQAWAREKGGTPKYINIAPTYWYYGEQMGIRPEILYAQAGWETNYGKYTGVVSEDMNNWAGIKVYGRNDDEKDAHETFATPEEGARAHFNHMSAYIGVEPFGEPHDRYYSVKSLAWAGTVKTLEQLGGKWCPDTEYGIKILNNCLIPMSKY